MSSVHRVEAVAQRVDGQRAVDPVVEDRVEHVRRASGSSTVVAQQLAEQVHGDAALAQHLGEAVVLLLGALHPQHVVEQQPVLVAGGEPLELQPRPVQDHLARAARPRSRRGTCWADTARCLLDGPLDGSTRNRRHARRGRPAQLRRDRRAGGLSASAVKRRVDRLRAAGAITGFTVRLDPGALGWTVEGYVELYCGAQHPAGHHPGRGAAVPRGGGGEHGLRRGRRRAAHPGRRHAALRAGAGADRGAPFVCRTKSVLVLSPLLRRPARPATPP